MDESRAKQLNPLSLAFVGDAVFSLYVRQLLAENHDNAAGGLHKMAQRYVKATAQAEIFDEISGVFDENESAIARRARNHRTSSKAKNAGLADYKKATAFEAVLGYLELTDKTERLGEILRRAVKIIDDKEKDNE
jgi:ribonuclease-3 family protein